MDQISYFLSISLHWQKSNFPYINFALLKYKGFFTFIDRNIINESHSVFDCNRKSQWTNDTCNFFWFKLNFIWFDLSDYFVIISCLSIEIDCWKLLKDHWKIALKYATLPLKFTISSFIVYCVNEFGFICVSDAAATQPLYIYLLQQIHSYAYPLQ